MDATSIPLVLVYKDEHGAIVMRTITETALSAPTPYTDAPCEFQDDTILVWAKIGTMIYGHGEIRFCQSENQYLKQKELDDNPDTVSTLYKQLLAAMCCSGSYSLDAFCPVS